MLKIKFLLHVQKESAQEKAKPPQRDGFRKKFRKGVCYGVGHSVGLFLGSKLPLDYLFDLASLMF